MNYANSRGMEGVFLSLDQEKAFDRVSHEYLFSTLEAFGVGEGFLNWVKALYSDISSSVLVNQFITESFPVTRSVRQGCSLSPLLYVLMLEPVLIKIRNDHLIKGFKLPGRNKEQKAAAFADDSKFTLADDMSVFWVLQWYDYYGKASASLIN